MTLVGTANCTIAARCMLNLTRLAVVGMFPKRSGGDGMGTYTDGCRVNPGTELGYRHTIGFFNAVHMPSVCFVLSASLWLAVVQHTVLY